MVRLFFTHILDSIAPLIKVVKNIPKNKVFIFVGFAEFYGVPQQLVAILARDLNNISPSKPAIYGF
jgi:hypothetical protein